MTSMIASDWHYQTEGMVNVLLCYIGDDDQQVGTLMRVKKRQKNTKTESNAERAQDQFCFVQNVVQKSLGRKYVHFGTRVSVSSDFLKQIQVHVESHQPFSRSDSEVDVDYPEIILLPNLSKIQWISSEDYDEHGTVSVEIKPKHGELYPSANWPKSKNCRFCMMQYLKIAQEKACCLSEYCPRDLFSSSPLRIMHALECLMATPQNNLIVKTPTHTFTQNKGGTSQNGEKEKTPTHHHIDLMEMEQTLSSTWSESIGPDLGLKTLIRALTTILYEDPILDRIKEMQHCPVEIEVIQQIYSHLVEHYEWNEESLHHDPIARSLRQELLSQGTSKVDAIVSNALMQSNSPDWVSSLSQEECHAFLLRFLVARTAMDVSLIITLAPCKPNGNVTLHKTEVPSAFDNEPPCWVHSEFSQEVVQLRSKENAGINLMLYHSGNGLKSSSFQNEENNLREHGSEGVVGDSGTQFFYFQVSVIDLDERPLSILPKYFLQDRQIVGTFLKEFPSD